MTLSQQQLTRYSRHLMLDDIAETGQDKLLSSNVLVVGMGGLGCPVSLYLAAAGIGKLSLCDADIVEESNLQRQVLYTTNDCGLMKVEAARSALSALNPATEITVYPESISADILAHEYSVIVDCTDNLAARHLLNRFCHQNRIPLVSASAIGWEGQFVAFDFGNERTLCLNCIIAEHLPEPLIMCGNNGVVGSVLGTMGSCQATAVIRMLLGYFQQHGEIQRYDGKRGCWISLDVKADPACGVCGKG